MVSAKEPARLSSPAGFWKTSRASTSSAWRRKKIVLDQEEETALRDPWRRSKSVYWGESLRSSFSGCGG
jgi:hypothetical protein